VTGIVDEYFFFFSLKDMWRRSDEWPKKQLRCIIFTLMTLK